MGQVDDLDGLTWGFCIGQFGVLDCSSQRFWIGQFGSSEQANLLILERPTLFMQIGPHSEI